MQTYSIFAGQTSQPIPVPGGALVSVTSGSASLEYTLGSLADIGNGVATWVVGVMPSVAERNCFVRFSSTSGGATLSVDQNPSQTAVQSVVGNSIAPIRDVGFSAELAALNGGITCVIAGDSRTQQNYDAISASGELSLGRPRWFTMLNTLLGQPFELVNNAGVNGETCTQLLARISSSGLGAGFGAFGDASTPVTTSPGVLATKPAVVFDYCGFNDIFNFSKTADATWKDKLAFFEAVRQSGALLVAMTIPPSFSGAPGYTTAKVAEMLKLNDMIRNYARSNRNVVLGDAYGVLVDKTSASIEVAANDFRDGIIHENNVGGYKVALELARVLGPLIPARNVLPASNADTDAISTGSNWIVDNPLLTGTAAITSTGFTGTTAGSNLANANFSRTGAMAIALTAESRAIGATSFAPVKDGYGQNIRAAITATAQEGMQVTLPSVHARVVTAGKYIAVAEVWAAKAFNNTGAAPTSLAVADNFAGVELAAQFTVAGANKFARDMAWANTDKPLWGAPYMVLKTLPIEIPAGAITVARPFLIARSAGAGSFEVQIGRVALKRVG